MLLKEYYNFCGILFVYLFIDEWTRRNTNLHTSVLTGEKVRMMGKGKQSRTKHYSSCVQIGMWSGHRWFITINEILDKLTQAQRLANSKWTCKIKFNFFLEILRMFFFSCIDQYYKYLKKHSSNRANSPTSMNFKPNVRTRARRRLGFLGAVPSSLAFLHLLNSSSHDL